MYRESKHFLPWNVYPEMACLTADEELKCKTCNEIQSYKSWHLYASFLYAQFYNKKYLFWSPSPNFNFFN